LPGDATSEDVSSVAGAEIYLIGIACIVMSIEVTEIFQLLEALALVAPNIGFEPCRDAALAPTGGALGPA
jgi:hypothetical protein